jgi:aromatic ring hydroxylase
MTPTAALRETARTAAKTMSMPETTISTSARPLTGDEYIESIRDGREVYLYGDRIKDVTTHPAFRNSVRMTARLYDALHNPKTRGVLTCPTDTGNGGYTMRFFRAARSAKDLVADRDAIAAWARLTYGWMGRSPDYKASFLGTLGANADFYDPFQDNARRWYRESQERVLYWNHAIVHPPVDRNRPPDEVADVFVHVEEERDNGLIVSGAKVVATGSAITHMNFIAHHGIMLKKKKFALICTIPIGAQGMKLICRPSYSMMSAVMGSPFDYPLSSRLDENDTIFILDRALIPWENVFVYGDLEKAITFFPRSGFLPRFTFPGLHKACGKARLPRRIASQGTGHHRLQGLPRRANPDGGSAGLAQHDVGADGFDGAQSGPMGRRYGATQRERGSRLSLVHDGRVSARQRNH